MGQDSIIKTDKIPSWYHVTTLSNFMRGYDKYKKQYSKDSIPQSTFPDQFFLLREDELPVGIDKGKKLLDKLGLSGDRLIALKTSVPEEQLRNDHASGVAQYIPQNYIDLDTVSFIDEDESGKPVLTQARVEDVITKSFAVLNTELTSWADLKPRSVSVLPIAMACQANCKFCFSKASASSDFERFITDWDRVEDVLARAKEAGAERAVITGGGEPTLLKAEQMTKLIGACAKEFNKVVLITNGHILGRMSEEDRRAKIREWDDAGLSVLAISRHHYDTDKNTEIMGLDTMADKVADSLKACAAELKNLKPRFICVLQQEGINSVSEIRNYLDWAKEHGVHEINFKELYVATTEESAYANMEANDFSADHQVSLRTVHDFAAANDFEKVAQLPWGSPIYAGDDMQVAAYTEPSVYWERTNGTVRSWNLMSDGTVLASLEDINSKVCPKV